MWALFSLSLKIFSTGSSEVRSTCRSSYYKTFSIISSGISCCQFADCSAVSVMRITYVLLTIALAYGAIAEDNSFENTGIRVALKVYEECNKAEGFSPCLKKKAITFFDRLSRMEKLPLSESIIVTRVKDAPVENPVTEEQLEQSLPRAADAQDAALNSMLMDKVTKFFGSRSIEVKLPKITPSDLTVEEGRGKKMKGMMGGMMMGIAAKMAAMIPVAIAGLFLLAGKALIIAKIALLLSGIIAIKKLVHSKHHGGGGGHSGGGGGWQSSGGGWDKRSIDVVNEAQKIAYKAYVPH